MDEKQIKPITAKEARAKTERSTFLLKMAYKIIDDEAARNATRADLDVYHCDSSVVAKVMQTLMEQGYEVEFLTDYDEFDNPVIDRTCVVIKW